MESVSASRASHATSAQLSTRPLGMSLRALFTGGRKGETGGAGKGKRTKIVHGKERRRGRGTLCSPKPRFSFHVKTPAAPRTDLYAPHSQIQMPKKEKLGGAQSRDCQLVFT